MGTALAPAFPPEPAPGCTLGGEPLLLSLGAEEPAVFQLSQDSRALDCGLKPSNQAFRAFALARGHISHSVLPVNRFYLAAICQVASLLAEAREGIIQRRA